MYDCVNKEQTFKDSRCLKYSITASNIGKKLNLSQNLNNCRAAASVLYF